MIDGPRIAFIGAGNLGQCMAAHMALAGYNVSLGNRTAARLAPIQESDNTITLLGAVKGRARLTLVSGKLDEVIRDREIIFLTVPADGHGTLMRIIAPHLRAGQHVILHPGHTFGALEARKIILDHDRSRSDITISEFQTSLFTTRAVSPGRVSVAALKKSMAFATLPATRTREVLSLLTPLYPQLHQADNVIQTGLDNLNAVVHPVVTLMNTARIEGPGDFLFYSEGVSPAVGRMLELVDSERQAIARSVGIKPCVLKDWMREVYGLEEETLHEIFSNNPAYRSITAPRRMDTRYILEDIPTGLQPMVSLARKMGVPTPVMDAFLTLSLNVLESGLNRPARTLEALGLGHLEPVELLEYVNTGLMPGVDV